MIWVWTFRKDGSRYDLKRIILYPAKKIENRDWVIMLSFSEFKKEVIGNYSEEELKRIWDMMQKLATLEYELFKKFKKQKDEESNNLYTSQY